MINPTEFADFNYITITYADGREGILIAIEDDIVLDDIARWS